MPLNAKVENVIIFNPLDAKTMVVKWDALLVTPPVVYYDVYRGLVEDFTKAKKVNPLPVFITQFQDTLPAGQVIRQNYYYFVIAHNASGDSSPSNAVASSPFSNFEAPKWNNQFYILKEFIRRKNIIMGRTGEQVKYYIRKVAGPRCPVCYDEIRTASLDPNCTACFGTTYEGGYVRVDTTLRVLGVQEIRTRKEMGIEISNNPAGWNITYPLVSSQDIIVRKNNLRYRIVSVTPIIHSGVLTEQGFILKELEPRTTEYLLN